MTRKIILNNGKKRVKVKDKMQLLIIGRMEKDVTGEVLICMNVNYKILIRVIITVDNQ